MKLFRRQTLTQLLLVSITMLSTAAIGFVSPQESAKSIRDRPSDAPVPGSRTPGSPISETRIPETHGVSLSGDRVALPDMLKGKVGILVLGFTQGSREEAKAWDLRLAGAYSESPTVLYLQLPVLASAPRLIRGAIVRSLRSSMPKNVQSRFVPVTTDEPAWRSLARFRRPDDAYVLIVDGDGRVRWQTQGAATEASVGAVKQQLRGLQVQVTGHQSK